MDDGGVLHGLVAGACIAFSALRLLAYLPQIVAVACGGGTTTLALLARIAGVGWHATAAVNSTIGASDALLAALMWGNCAGAAAIAALTIAKRRATRPATHAGSC